MADNTDSYLVFESVTIKRKEGNTGKIVLQFPSTFDPADYGIKFQVVTRGGDVVFAKTESDMTISSQNVTIPLVVNDTKGKSGNHIWECEITDTGVLITTGEGPFKIPRKYIKDL